MMPPRKDKLMKGKQIASLLFALAACVCALCGCTGGKTQPDVSMYDLKSAMAEAAAFEEMAYAGSEDADAETLFSNISDMAYSKVLSFFVYYAVNGTGNADELAVIRVKNAADLTEARSSLEAHPAKRRSLYATYDKSQLKKLEGARIEVEGGCAALIVADGADRIAEAFHTFLNGN